MLCDGAETVVERMPDVVPEEAIAHGVAAARELFEEAGVLLARTSGGAMVRVPLVDGERFRAYRHGLAAHTTTLVDVASSEHFRLDLSAVAYFAHWVTPGIEPRRFDTRFFIALAPEGQDATHDEHETTHGSWVDPAEAIEQCRQGSIALPPPTWTTLRALERFADVDTAMTWARSLAVPRIEPRVVVNDDAKIIILPGDADFTAVPGFEPIDTRFVLEGGRWRPLRP